MNISILTLFSELYSPFLSTSLIGRAQKNCQVKFDVTSLFSFAAPKERIDAPTFGHGAGVLIKPIIIEKAIEQQEQKHGKAFKIFFSPQGKKLDQRMLEALAAKLSTVEHILLLAPRYEGIDDRVEEYYADEVISVGDFIVMGGDVPAMLFLEGFLRLVPGVVGKQESVAQESFSGPFLDHPEYTEPVVWKDREVPSVVRSGDHGAIATWRLREALKKTLVRHFGWLRSHVSRTEDKQRVLAEIPHHYAALMHEQVLLADKTVGTTSVTSLDIHDIARSAATFGIKNYFVVTPLIDQQKIVRKLMEFWMSPVGIDYNRKRHEAVSLVRLEETLSSVIAAIEQKEGKKPVIIVTSARHTGILPDKIITYNDQGTVWALDRPVLLVFGTGHGLAESVIAQADYVLVPVEGFTGFNHLSVRSAVGIILDRWLGINPV